MNYPWDLLTLRHGRINDGALRFSGRRQRAASAPASTSASAQTSESAQAQAAS